jgi:Spy/CpxP family protein refolding chaperone
MDAHEGFPAGKRRERFMKRWLKLVAAVCVVLFLAVPFSYGAVKKKRTDEPQIRKWWERPKVVKQLGVTEQQLAAVKEIYDGSYNQIVEERWNYRQQKSQLEDLHRQTDLDEARIKEQTEQVQAARAVLEKTVTEMQNAMMKELSPEQRRQLLTILKNWKEDKPQKKKRKKDKDRRPYSGR